MHEIPVQLLNGLVVGSSLALVSSGLALLFGVLDIINFAQGDYFMLGGYVLWLSLPFTGNFWLSVLLAAVVVGIGGGLLLMGMVWPLLDRSQALVLLATLGLSLILEQLATNIFGADTKVVRAPIAAQIPVGIVHYPVYDLLIVAVGLLVLLAGYFLLKYAKYGIWLRAVAQNRPMAAALGVPVPRVYALAFIASSALAGIAGSLLVPVTSVYPTVGADVILRAFIVVVAGGLGNFRGAALVAILLGEVEALGSIAIRPVEVEILLFALVIGLLVVRSRRETALVRL
jgi:branched-chain amino acid transport system permease protein